MTGETSETEATGLGHAAGQPGPVAADGAAADSLDAAQLDAARLETALKEKDELTALLQRVQADFVNYRKRVQTEQEETRRGATRGLVMRLLGVLDQFDTALGGAGVDGGEGWFEGFQAIQRGLLAALRTEGVEPFDSEGVVFDPREHEALLTRETADHPANTVVRVLRPGYRMHGEVLRAAQVEIATAPAETDDGSTRPQEEAGEA